MTTGDENGPIYGAHFAPFWRQMEFFRRVQGRGGGGGSGVAISSSKSPLSKIESWNYRPPKPLKQDQ